VSLGCDIGKSAHDLQVEFLVVTHMKEEERGGV
jgi:hypothetical protein